MVRPPKQVRKVRDCAKKISLIGAKLVLPDTISFQDKTHCHNCHVLFPMIVLLTLVLATTEFLFCQIPESTAVEYVKLTPVSEIDSSLPHIPFSQWLQEIVGDSIIVTWELNDCGEQTGNPGIDSAVDIPSCVEADCELAPGQRLSIFISIGTNKRGITGGPEVFDIYLQTGAESHSFRSLSALKMKLRN